MWRQVDKNAGKSLGIWTWNRGWSGHRWEPSPPQPATCQAQRGWSRNSPCHENTINVHNNKNQHHDACSVCLWYYMAMFHKQTENKITHDVLIDGNKCNWVCAIAIYRLLWFIWKSPESRNLRFWLLVFSVFFDYSLPHWKIGRVPVITDIHLKRKRKRKEVPCEPS